MARRCGAMLACAAATLLLTGGSGLAAEGAGGWRATYDLVMMWVNFAILVVLLVKYLRQPLRKFLDEESRRIAQEMERIETIKGKMDARFEETQRTVAEGRARLQLIRQRILSDGERRREAIIASAREESRLLLARTRLKIDAQMAEAYLQLKCELVERSVAIALERLPAVITAEDHLRLVDRFLRQTARS